MKDQEAFEEWWQNMYDSYVEFRDWQGCDIAFDKKEDMRIGWQAACEFKQKEIDKWETAYEDEARDHQISLNNLQKEINELKDGSYWQSDIERLEAENSMLKENINGTRMKQMNERIEELLIENAKLRECVGFYADYRNDNPDYDWNNDYARQVLKELGNKNG